MIILFDFITLCQKKSYNYNISYNFIRTNGVLTAFFYDTNLNQHLQLTLSNSSYISDSDNFN